MTIKTSTVQMIEVSDWDQLVQETYGKPYNFQQQDDGKPRGTHELTVPCKYADDYENDVLEEKVNGPNMGVSFAAWLARDPKEWSGDEDGRDRDWHISLWWERNFYPDVEMIANDLHEKGLLPTGNYVINIDW